MSEVLPIHEFTEPCPFCGQRDLMRPRALPGLVCANCSVTFVNITRDTWNRRDGKTASGKRCPSCGKPLLVRKSKKGQPFWGCSAYPNCKQTLPYHDKTDGMYERMMAAHAAGSYEALDKEMPLAPVAPEEFPEFDEEGNMIIKTKSAAKKKAVGDMFDALAEC